MGQPPSQHGCHHSGGFGLMLTLLANALDRPLARRSRGFRGGTRQHPPLRLPSPPAGCLDAAPEAPWGGLDLEIR